MRITYFALKPVQVGEDMREIGDLVPEAAEWRFVSGYVNDGHLAPVLVATLPEEQQIMLLDWEAEMTEAAPEITPEPNDEPLPEAVPEATPPAAEPQQSKSKSKSEKVA